MTTFIINPRPLGSEETILSAVRIWLQTLASKGRPSEQSVFDQKWEALEADDRLILAALIEEGGNDVKEVSILRRLIQQHGIERNRASTIIREGKTVLSARNLVRLQRNLNDGDEMSLHRSLGMVCPPR